MFKKKTVGYVSEIDRFLTDFDQTHPLSATQQAEKQKFKRIFKLRDHPID